MTSRAGTRSAVAAVLVLGVAIVLAALAVHSSRPGSDPFVRTFDDPDRYASTVAQRTSRVEWTPEIGREVAARAERWLGTPYSFAGGGYTGPSLGKAVDEDSRNDGHVRGFDCSGLVMYALAPYQRLTHYAATQYVQAGQVHPARSQLLPGDLVFWSADGTVRGVGHVAVYLGGGKVVQAPQSGDVVKITALDQVETGVIGTTRPLTRS